MTSDPTTDNPSPITKNILPRQFIDPIWDILVFRTQVTENYYSGVMDCIEAMDSVLHDYKNWDLDID